ncbi:MAG TPA: efflux RND transporter permease subunit, partial [Candidatus Baltobacteraceae bacterium]|nr:efflux RND transporter permease subunit [Candidatus Baltobacteraceae bacterium]
MWLTRFAIARPVIVAMATIALAIFGIKSYLSLGVSLFPNVAFPVVIVNATYPGAAPATMEKLIVKPIEDQLQGIEHLDQLTATAQEGVATVVVQFKLDTDLDFAATQVQERVNAARGFMPSDLDPPTVLKNSSNSDPMLEEAVSSNTLSAAQIGDLVNNEIKPELESVPGVVNVAVRGDVGREFHVFPDLARLYGLGGTLLDVYNTIAPNNSTLPGGRMDTPTSETSVAVHADIVQAADMQRFPLPAPLVFPMPTSAVRPSLGQVARVEDGHIEQRYPTRFNGASAVIIDVQRTVDADEVKTTADVRAAFAKLIVQYPRLHFREFQANADYTQASISGVMQSLLEGIALTAIVMLLFLHAWRNAVVVMIAIPTSLLATFGVMSLMGFTIDVISMMGMGLTIGILVDDSIVVLENIARHRDMGAAPLDAAYKGRTEIGSAAVTITLVDVVVFLPIAFLSGIVGKYMKEFGIVIVVATLFSLLVSFTLTPLLAGRWSMKKPELGIPRWAAWFIRGFDRLQNLYVAVILPWVLRHRLFIAFFCVLLVVNALSLAFAPRTIAAVDLFAALVFFVCSLVVKVLTRLGHLQGAASSPTRASDFLMSGAVTCVVAGIMCFAPVLGGEFIPASDSGVLLGSVTFPAGTPLVATATDLNRFASEATKIRDVASVITSGGVKVDGYTTTIGGNDGRITIVLDPTKRKSTDRVLAAVRALDWTFPGARFQISKIGGSGAGSPISYSISGPDSVLDEAVGKVIALLRAQPGALNLQSSA